MNFNIEKIKIVLKEFFYVLFCSIVIFSVLEVIRPGTVLSYFNINYLLIFWLIVGILLLALNKESS